VEGGPTLGVDNRRVCDARLDPVIRSVLLGVLFIAIVIAAVVIVAATLRLLPLLILLLLILLLLRRLLPEEDSDSRGLGLCSSEVQRRAPRVAREEIGIRTTREKNLDDPVRTAAGRHMQGRHPFTVERVRIVLVYTSAGTNEGLEEKKIYI
jgi:hypothetical protein